MSDIGADVLAEWRVVPEDVAQMLLRNISYSYFLFHCTECSISKIYRLLLYFKRNLTEGHRFISFTTVTCSPPKIK